MFPLLQLLPVSVSGRSNHPLVLGLGLLQAYDKAMLSTHQFCQQVYGHNKTPYELLHDRKPDLKYFHVFGALCYPTNDNEDLGKLKPKAVIRIFIGYSPAEENANDVQDKDEQARIEQPENVQAKESVLEPQVEQPVVPHPSSSQTLFSVEYGNQFINANPDVSLTDVLKEPVEAEVQSLVDVPILQQKPADQRPPLVDTTMTLIPETTLSPK
ncbi:hypothetical protein Tco_0839472 [Tanacetum coccineum]|uniref:Retrovirus-related Pol polyprotein from transposon TNT 1-94 n=1 Tax=Tanacetum coccineum TaxID=301880 RepID=A0ABQ5ARC4_9ASTR